MQEKPKMDVEALQSKLWKMFSRYALLNDLVISKACEFNPKQLCSHGLLSSVALQGPLIL